MSARLYQLDATARKIEEIDPDPPRQQIDKSNEKINQLAISLNYLEIEARRSGFDCVAKLIQAACIATKDELNQRQRNGQ